MTVFHSGTRTRPRRFAHLGLATSGAVALVVLSAGSATAALRLDAVDDVATPLTSGGTASASLLANDIGQDGRAADCQDVNTAVKNCDFDPASLSQQGTNGVLEIEAESGNATYTTFLDPADPEYAVVAAGATCTGLLDTFEYTLIGYEPDAAPADTVVAPFAPVPGSTDTATISVVSGTGLRTPGAVNDTSTTKVGTPVSGNVLVNDCDQTNTTPASPQNVAASLATSPAHGKADVAADGTAVYTPNSHFTGTDSFTYTITTIDAGAPRTSTATVTVTVAAAPVVTPPPPNATPGLPNTGTDVVPMGLAGAGLLLLGSALVVFARRRRTEIG
ncbi:MAG: Ig-like domain-containing protein [Geodermatophilaceae bacterium]|nr:Ig-like domain-containing protein [Geodermatophilaceae bacterium]